MKNWNIPSVEELEVKLTASSGIAGTSEYGATGGDYGNPDYQAHYDSSIYEKLTDDATCTVEIENSSKVES